MDKRDKWIIRILTIVFALMFSVGSFAYAANAFEYTLDLDNGNIIKQYMVEGVSDEAIQYSFYNYMDYVEDRVSTSQKSQIYKLTDILMQYIKDKENPKQIQLNNTDMYVEGNATIISAQTKGDYDFYNNNTNFQRQNGEWVKFKDYFTNERIISITDLYTARILKKENLTDSYNFLQEKKVVVGNNGKAEAPLYVKNANDEFAEFIIRFMGAADDNFEGFESSINFSEIPVNVSYLVEEPVPKEDFIKALNSINIKNYMNNVYSNQKNELERYIKEYINKSNIDLKVLARIIENYCSENFTKLKNEIWKKIKADKMDAFGTGYSFGNPEILGDNTKGTYATKDLDDYFLTNRKVIGNSYTVNDSNKGAELEFKYETMSVSYKEEKSGIRINGKFGNILKVKLIYEGENIVSATGELYYKTDEVSENKIADIPINMSATGNFWIQKFGGKAFRLYMKDNNFDSVFIQRDSSYNVNNKPEMFIFGGTISQNDLGGSTGTQTGEDGNEYKYTYNPDTKKITIYKPGTYDTVYCVINIAADGLYSRNLNNEWFYDYMYKVGTDESNGKAIYENPVDDLYAIALTYGNKRDVDIYRKGLYEKEIYLMKSMQNQDARLNGSYNIGRDQQILIIPISSENKAIVETNNEERETTELVGINRQITQKENIEAIKKFILSYAMPFLAFVVLLAVIVIGFKAIGNSLNQNAKERMELMESFKNIFIGVIIVTFAATIVSIAFSYLSDVTRDLSELNEVNIQFNAEDEFKDQEKPGPLVRAFGEVANFLVRGARTILHWIPGYGTVEELLISPKVKYGNIEYEAGSSIEENFEAKMNSVFLLPFNQPKFDVYTKVYMMLVSVCSPLLLVAILKIGFMYIIYSTNYQQVAQAKDDAKRILIALLFIILGPYIFRFILLLFNMLVLLIPYNYKGQIIREINAGFIGTILGGIWLLYLEAKLTFIFLVREVVLTVMYIIMPIVAAVWAISNKTRLMRIWWGEVISNAMTQLVYALVFYIATIALGSFKQHWLMYLVWMTMVIKLSKALKNALQPEFFGALAGVDEEGAAQEAMGTAMNFGKRAANIASGTLDTANKYKNGGYDNKGLNFLTDMRAVYRTATGKHKWTEAGGTKIGKENLAEKIESKNRGFSSDASSLLYEMPDSYTDAAGNNIKISRDNPESVIKWMKHEYAIRNKKTTDLGSKSVKYFGEYLDRTYGTDTGMKDKKGDAIYHYDKLPVSAANATENRLSTSKVGNGARQAAATQENASKPRENSLPDTGDEGVVSQNIIKLQHAMSQSQDNPIAYEALKTQRNKEIERLTERPEYKEAARMREADRKKNYAKKMLDSGIDAKGNSLTDKQKEALQNAISKREQEYKEAEANLKNTNGYKRGQQMNIYKSEFSKNQKEMEIEKSKGTSADQGKIQKLEETNRSIKEQHNTLKETTDVAITNVDNFLTTVDRINQLKKEDLYNS